MRRHVPMTTLAATCALLVAACTRAPAPDAATDAAPAAASVAPTSGTPAPAADVPAPTTDDVVATALATLYGPDARATGEWTTVPADAALRVDAEAAGDVTRRVCARGAGGKPGEVLVAVCGQLKAFGHPTAGVLDLFLLRAGADPVAARMALRDVGSMGNPGEVAVRRLGATLAGFESTSGFFNMGEGVQTRRLFVPRDGRFEEAGWMHASRSYRGDCDGDAECPNAFDVRFDLRIDDSNPRAAAYPLVVTEQGRACGRDVQATHTLAFDPGTFRYVIPDALKRERGCADGAAS